MTDILQCGRCDREGGDVRLVIANREREAHQDGRPFFRPSFAIEPRCPDKDACRARVAADREARDGAA